MQVTEHEGMKSRNEKGLIIIGIDKARLDSNQKDQQAENSTRRER